MLPTRLYYRNYFIFDGQFGVVRGFTCRDFIARWKGRSQLSALDSPPYNATKIVDCWRVKLLWLRHVPVSKNKYNECWILLSSSSVLLFLLLLLLFVYSFFCLFLFRSKMKLKRTGGPYFVPRDNRYTSFPFILFFSPLLKWLDKHQLSFKPIQMSQANRASSLSARRTFLSQREFHRSDSLRDCLSNPRRYPSHSRSPHSQQLRQISSKLTPTQ